jgi:hypothetical protein
MAGSPLSQEHRRISGADISRLFDQVVGTDEERQRHFNPERFRGLEIDNEFKPGRLLHGQITGPRRCLLCYLLVQNRRTPGSRRRSGGQARRPVREAAGDLAPHSAARSRRFCPQHSLARAVRVERIPVARAAGNSERPQDRAAMACKSSRSIDVARLCSSLNQYCSFWS